MSELSILQKVDLGGLAAEEDANLERYFLTTNNFAKVHDEQAFLVLGQKGSGKSSIALMLAKDPNKAVLDLSPNQFLWSRVKEFTDTGVPSPHAEKYAWALTIFQSAANWAIFGMPQDDGSESRSSLKRFLQEQNLLLHELTFLETIKRQIGKVALSIGSIAELSFDKDRAQPKRPVMAELNRQLDNVDKEFEAGHRHVSIVIDKLDEFWDGSDDANNRLIGLLLAAREMNYRLKNLKTFVFLRSDIYRTLRFPDKDKFPAIYTAITWTEQGLTDLLEKRVAVSLGIKPGDALQRLMVAEVTGVRSRGGRRKALDYIFDIIHERPRDLLTFCNFAKEEALSKNHHLIESEDLTSAYAVFSNTKRGNIEAEYSAAFPPIGTLLEALARSRVRVSYEVLRRTLQDACQKGSLEPDSAIRALVEREVLGVVERGEGGEARELYYYNEPSITERIGMKSTVYCIHPSLRPALRTVEVRTYFGE